MASSVVERRACGESGWDGLRQVLTFDSAAAEAVFGGT